MELSDQYIAGFFDGEGSVSIVRNRAQGKSDYHKIVVHIGQRAKYRAVLDAICEKFGGTVAVRQQTFRIAAGWAEHADWQLQDKPGIDRFLRAMQPHCIIKARQITIGLEFVATFQQATNLRDALGRIRGKMLSANEIEHRERIRLAMRDANELGPPRVKPSTLPPLDIQHRQRMAEDLTPNVATVEHGTQRWNAKLTDEAVRAIRADFAAGGVSKSELARRYEVSDMLIGGIIRGTRWGHVT